MSYLNRLTTILIDFVFNRNLKAKFQKLTENSAYTQTIILLLGCPGSGKTHLINTLENHNILYINCQPNLEITDFYEQLLNGLFLTSQEHIEYQVLSMSGKRYRAVDLLEEKDSQSSNIIVFDNTDKLGIDVINEISYLFDTLKNHSFILLAASSPDLDPRLGAHKQQLTIQTLTEYDRWNTLHRISDLFPEDIRFHDILTEIEDNPDVLDDKGDLYFNGIYSRIYLPATPRDFINKMQIACGIADAKSVTPDFTAQFFPDLPALIEIDAEHLEQLEQVRTSIGQSLPDAIQQIADRALQSTAED